MRAFPYCCCCPTRTSCSVLCGWDSLCRVLQVLHQTGRVILQQLGHLESMKTGRGKIFCRRVELILFCQRLDLLALSHNCVNEFYLLILWLLCHGRGVVCSQFLSHLPFWDNRRSLQRFRLPHVAARLWDPLSVDSGQPWIITVGLAPISVLPNWGSISMVSSRQRAHPSRFDFRKVSLDWFWWRLCLSNVNFIKKSEKHWNIDGKKHSELRH